MAASKATSHPSFYIDSHCHFDFAAFDKDRKAVWRSCAENNIRQLLIPGVAPKQWDDAESLSDKFPGLFFAAGLHPCWLKDFFADIDDIERVLNKLTGDIKASLNHAKCLAVGECGMDKTIDADLRLQQKVFSRHLQIAKEQGTVVIVHSLKTHNQVLRSIKDESFTCGGVIHAFSGSREMAEQFIAEDFYIGVGGVITYERAQKTRDAVRHIPLERILLETDAPDMPIKGHQGERNSPETIPIVAQTLAKLRDEDPNTIMEVTSQNAIRLFSFPSDDVNFLDSPT